MLKQTFVLFVCFLYGFAYADDCIKYKQIPSVKIINPIYERTVVQPEHQMNKLHGTVLATLVEDFDLIVDIIATGSGYCVVLKEIDATIGYSDFTIEIDKSHIHGSCSYNAILGHEYKHIDAYLSVIKDMDFDIKNSVFNAVNSITPIFVPLRKDVDSAIENMNLNIQSHPEIILMKQKINASQEIRNKRIDQNENNADLNKCLQI